MEADPIVVVGSGASAVHFALSLLERGHRVCMLDVGRSAPSQPAPETDLEGLRLTLDDPIGYFLGTELEDLAMPRADAGYNMLMPWLSPGARDTEPPDQVRHRHGFPHQSEHVFRGLPQFAMRSDGFAPFVSFARGGLAEAWTAGAFPFTAQDLASFPFAPEELTRHYATVAERIGISGVVDDLEPYLPGHAGLLAPLPLSGHAESLLQAYAKRRDRIRDELGVVLGRSRSAVLSEPRGERGGCTQLGRCVRGCPRNAIYAPRHSLAECLRFEGFEYLPNRFVRHFAYDAAGRVRALHVEDLDSGAVEPVEVGTLVLGAGCLGSARIVLESVYRATGESPQLMGLMDTRMVTIPFLTPARLGLPAEPGAFQFHQLCFALELEGLAHPVHGQLSLTQSTSVHALAQVWPVGLGNAASLMRHLKPALGMATVALPDTRRDDCMLTLEPVPGQAHMRLAARYRPAPGEAARIREAARRTRGLLRALGSLCPPYLQHARPPGAGIHYAGTLPMRREPARFAVDAQCRSYDFPNLFVIDGSTFPALPAKGPTLSLMANAVRVAEAAF